METWWTNDFLEMQSSDKYHPSILMPVVYCSTEGFPAFFWITALNWGLLAKTVQLLMEVNGNSAISLQEEWTPPRNNMFDKTTLEWKTQTKLLNWLHKTQPPLNNAVSLVLQHDTNNVRVPCHAMKLNRLAGQYNYISISETNDWHQETEEDAQFIPRVCIISDTFL